MNIPFKYIAVLVVATLTAIFGYQVYWLVKMYDTEKEQTRTIIQSAIRNADHIEIFARVDSVSNEKDKTRHNYFQAQADNSGDTHISYSVSFNRDETPDSTYVEFDREIITDEAEIKRKERLKQKLDSEAVKVGEGYKSLETIALQAQQGLHSAVDEAIGGVSLRLFDSILNSDLQKSNIDIVHYSQVVFIPNDSIIKTNLPPGLDVTGMDVYNHIYDIHQEYAYRIYTSPLNSMVIKQLAGILASSFAIIVLLGFSFWYLIHTIMKQKTLDEMKTDFTNNITHELKTPIAVAYAATDALLNFRQADDKQKREKYLNITQEQLQRLSGLVEQILSMIMEKRSNLRLKEEEVQIKSLIDALIEQHTLKAGKHAHFTTDIEPGDITIITDRTHFNNILSNLIDNAVKYSPDNIDVTIRTRIDNGKQLELSVSDKGTGIAPDKQKYIFDKFYRVPSGNLHDVKGYGLGLHYVKGMVEKMGGNIEVKSELSKGSTFTLHLNLNR